METVGTSADSLPRLKMDVSTVLRKQEQSPCKEYDILLFVLAEPNTEAQVLTKYVRQLRDCVSLVTKEHERLVGIILNLDWLDRGPALTREYKPLLLNLVSAHPYYLRACIRMLIKKFFPHDTSKSQKAASSSEKGPDKATRENDEARFTHVHELFKAIAKIVPTTRTVALQLMKESFPYHTRDVYSHETFTRNLLQVVHYMPDLRLQILELLVEKMLQLDVRAPRKDIVEAEDSSDEEDDDNDDDGEPTVFQMEGLEAEEEAETAKAEAEEVTSQTMNHKEAMRLDVMMDLTFSYIHSTCYQNGELNWEVTKQLYRELLSVFNKFIFPTHASCHAQYLMFYICSFRKELLVGFLDFLWKKVKNPMTQNVFRQAGAGYLGSFLARAAYIHISTLKTTVKMMASWLHDYLNQAGSDGLHADLAHHAPFYAVCQAVFYVFCFRSQQLLELDKGYKWAESLNFQRLVSSKLNPLRLCLPLICTTLASVTRKHQLAFCDTIIQRNNRVKFASSSEPTLEAYFPFDPYLLKQSSRWVKSLYREYEGVLPDSKKEEDDEDEDYFLPDEEDMEVSMGLSLTGTSADKMDFLQYGISPGFKK